MVVVRLFDLIDRRTVDSGGLCADESVHTQIVWPAAIFGAAVLGGVVYGLVVSLSLMADFEDWRGWLPALAVTFGMALVGSAISVMGRVSALRTVGAAIAIASLSGGPFVVEFFIVWLVNANG